MSLRGHEAVAQLAAPYALGVLPANERQVFVSHLTTCVECRREVAELSRVVEAMPQTLDQAALPPSLKARVLAAALSTDTARRHAIGEQRVVIASRWVAWLAAAASLAAVVFGAFAWNGRTETARLRTQLAVAQQREAALDRQIGALEDSAGHTRQTAAILRAGDLGRVELVGQAGAPGASGRVLWSASQGLVFVATNLPPLPPGRVYQLWVVADKPLSAGIVVPDSAGRLTVINSEPVAARPKAFALTIEPEGGRSSPTGPMLLVGSNE